MWTRPLATALLCGALLVAAACSSEPSADPGPAPAATSDPAVPSPSTGEAAPVQSGDASSTEGTSVVESGAPCRPLPAVSTPLPDGYPEGLALPPGTTLTGVQTQGGFGLVTGRTAASVDEVLEHFRTAVESAGLVVQRIESEGRSGQVAFFGALTQGGVAVARLTCPRGETGFTVRSRASGAAD